MRHASLLVVDWHLLARGTVMRVAHTSIVAARRVAMHGTVLGVLVAWRASEMMYCLPIFDISPQPRESRIGVGSHGRRGRPLVLHGMQCIQLRY